MEEIIKGKQYFSSFNYAQRRSLGKRSDLSYCRSRSPGKRLVLLVQSLVLLVFALVLSLVFALVLLVRALVQLVLCSCKPENQVLNSTSYTA